MVTITNFGCKEKTLPVESILKLGIPPMNYAVAIADVLAVLLNIIY